MLTFPFKDFIKNTMFNALVEHFFYYCVQTASETFFDFLGCMVTAQ